MCWGGDGGDGNGGDDGVQTGEEVDISEPGVTVGPDEPGYSPDEGAYTTGGEGGTEGGGPLTGAPAGEKTDGPLGRPGSRGTWNNPNIDVDDLPGSLPRGAPINRSDEEETLGNRGPTYPSEWTVPGKGGPPQRESSDPKDDDFVGPPDPRTGGGFEPRSKEGMDVREEYWDETRNWPGIPGALPWAYYTDPTNLTDLRDALIDLATPMAFKVGQALVGNLGNIEVSHTAPEDSPDFVESDGGEIDERVNNAVIEEAVDNQRRAAATSANRFAPGSTVPYARFREGWRDDEALGTSLGDGRFGTRRTVLTGQ